MPLIAARPSPRQFPLRPYTPRCDFGDPQPLAGPECPVTGPNSVGMTLVSTRQRPRQFPLRPHTFWEKVDYSNLNRRSDRIPACGPGIEKETEGVTLVFTRHSRPNVSFAPKNVECVGGADQVSAVGASPPPAAAARDGSPAAAELCNREQETTP